MTPAIQAMRDWLRTCPLVASAQEDGVAFRVGGLTGDAEVLAVTSRSWPQRAASRPIPIREASDAAARRPSSNPTVVASMPRSCACKATRRRTSWRSGA